MEFRIYGEHGKFFRFGTTELLFALIGDRSLQQALEGLAGAPARQSKQVVYSGNHLSA